MNTNRKIYEVQHWHKKISSNYYLDTSFEIEGQGGLKIFNFFLENYIFSREKFSIGYQNCILAFPQVQAKRVSICTLTASL